MSRKYLRDTVEHQQGIVWDTAIESGLAMIEGTEVDVSVVIEELGHGKTVYEVAEEHGLELIQVVQSLNYVVKVLRRPYH